MAEAGTPLRELMRLGGWKKPEMALRYMRRTKYSTQLALEAMDRAFGGAHQIPTNPGQVLDFRRKSELGA